MSATLSVSSQGVELLETWEAARKRMEKLRAQYNALQTELEVATNALGKWMVPDDPTENVNREQYNIWVCNGLLAARQIGVGQYEVSWRKTPSGEGARRLESL